MNYDSIVNDLLQIMEMGLSNNNVPKAFIMNRKTARAISVDPIPVGPTWDSFKIFGMTVFYEENLPDYIIGILDQSYALGYTLINATDKSKANKFNQEISKVAAQGSFIYDEIQFYGLTDTDLPEWQPKTINDELKSNKYDSSRPYSNRYDLVSTVKYLTELRNKIGDKSYMVFIMNRMTQQDIYEVDGLPDDFINPLKKKLLDIDIVYIDYTPWDVVGIMPVEEANRLNKLFSSNEEAGKKFVKMLGTGELKGFFDYMGHKFVGLNVIKPKKE